MVISKDTSMKSLILLTTTAFLSLSLSGCLKSRLQLRGDAEDQESSHPVATQVTSVQETSSEGSHGSQLHVASYVLDEVKGELTRLNGRVEELERNKPDPEALKAEKEVLRKLEARIIELEQGQANLIEAFQKVRQAAPAETPETQDLFRKGKIKFEANLCDEVIEDLSEYLRNPRAPQAEDATFYRAECYFKLKQYKKAIVDYSRFPERYTHSKRMPVVLFKIGSSFEALGMKEDARGFYQELIEKFPKTIEAGKARSKVK